MANIRVDVDHIITDGCQIKFRSPVDCSAVTGLIVYYPGADGLTTSTVFAFADAHGNNVGDIDHLFAENVVVNIILDVTSGMAFVQNADTNKYIEENFLKKYNANGDWSVDMAGHRLTGLPLPQAGSEPATKEFVENFTVEGSTYVATDDNKDGNIVLRPYVADADELEFRDHIKNKENPHGVTPAQIGAASSGLIGGVGSYPTYANFMQNLKSIYGNMPTQTKRFLYMTIQAAGDISNGELGGGVWCVELNKVDNRYGYAEATSYSGTGKVRLHRQEIFDSEWKGWKDESRDAFAPSGYGLGEAQASAPEDNDANKAIYNGVYTVYSSTANTPKLDGVLIVSTRSYGYAHQTLIPTAYHGCTLIRQQDNGTWGNWEWLNPPMAIGKEYRTMERWQGQPVYTALIYYGKGTTSGNFNIQVRGVSGINVKFIDAFCKAEQASTGWSLNLDRYLTYGEYGSDNAVYVVTHNSDLSKFDIYLTVKYYKV